MYSVATTARRAGLLAAAAGTASLLTACGSGTPAATPTKTVTTTATAAGAPAPAATPSTTTPAPTAPASCLSSGLQASLGPGQGAAGTLYQVIVLTNTSKSACTLYGYPGVSFVTGPGGTVIGAPASRNPLIPDTLITLQPGEAASALAGIADTGALPQSACKPGTSDWLQIYPPGDRGSLLVQYRAQVCTRPGEKYMRVTAMHAGTTGSF
jgi:hypothetical protein